MPTDQATRLQPDTDHDAIFRSVARRYRDSGRFARTYVAMKLRWDPVHADVLSYARRQPFGHVVDVGCGRGQLAVALLESRGAQSVLGLDWNRAHLSQATAAARGLAFRAVVQNLAHRPIVAEADTVLLIDVLYQLDTEPQQALLSAAARAARRLILVRTADPRRGWRSSLSRALEVLGRRFWPSAGARVNAPPTESIAAMLREAGFAVEQTPCWRGTPFANVLLDATRGADGLSRISPPAGAVR